MFALSLYERIVRREETVAVVGLGYVGLPIAVAFSKCARVIGFDIQESKIEQYRQGIDATGEVGNAALAACAAEFTSDEKRLSEAKFLIVAVPTPIYEDKTPNLSILEEATRAVGRHLTKGSIVVYESTVYPGVTEEVCVPLLEAESGLRCGVDFKVGYSPERINPGDQTHRLETIVKVVSAMDEETLEEVALIYGLVAQAGVHRAPSIRVAEAAKVIENSQRDINIAFMNELSLLFDKMDIDMRAVLEAASTKWNFLPFTPGLVGGHCVGVDPYYLTYKAAQIGYDSRIIAAGRRINDEMGRHVARQAIRLLSNEPMSLGTAKVAILGFSFKENCPDTRNSRVADIYQELCECGVTPLVADPLADPADVQKEHGVTLVGLDQITQADLLIVAVAHDAFRIWTLQELERFFRKNGSRILMDVKGMWDRKASEDAGFTYWSL